MIHTLARLSLMSVVALASAGAASADIFLKTPTVQGDAAQRGFEGQIALSGVNMGISTFTMPDPDGLRDEVRSTNVSPIFISKLPDRSSARLMAAAIEGAPLGRIEITFTAPARPGSSEVVEARWIIEGAEVRGFNVNTDPSNGNRPIESVEISYSSMTYQYFTKDAKGVRSGSMEETKWRVPDEQLFPYDAGCR
ncbi:MAG: type VI secretion system tube protein Hcp [Hyphomonadaceae bacterium]